MKKVLKTVLLSALMLFVVVASTSCAGSLTFDGMLCSLVTFIGEYDGSAKATVGFNSDVMLTMMKDLSTQKKMEILAFMATVKTYCEPKENLKNGDEITVTIKYDEEIAKKAGINFINNTYKKTVDGLSPLKEVDVLEPFSMEFSGISPYAEGKITKDNKIQMLYGIKYKISVDGEVVDETSFFPANLYKLKNGSEVKVTADFTGSAKEDNARVGVLPICGEKTFTVSVADKYLLTKEDVEKKTLEEIDTAVNDYQKDFFETGLNAPDSDITERLLTDISGNHVLLFYTFALKKMDNVSLSNRYLLSVKDGANIGYNDSISSMYYFYKVDIEGTYQTPGEAEKTKSYKDGIVAFYIKEPTVRGEKVSFSKPEYAGAYASFDDAYGSCISANVEAYDFSEIKD